MKPETALNPAPTAIFRTLAEQMAGVVGQDFFRHLVRTLAVSLDVEYAFITTRKPQDPSRLVLVAGWHVNRAATGGNDLLLEGTPAARTLLEGQLWHEDGTAVDYPKDSWLRKHGVRAYCAVVIPGLDNRAAGHLGIMSRQPFQTSDELFGALHTLAARVAAELRRARLDEIQRLASVKFAAGFRIAPEIIGVLELETTQLTDISPSVERRLGYSPAELIGRNLTELDFLENPRERDQLLRELQAGGRIVNRGIGVHTRLGESRHGLLTAETLDFDQHPHALFSIVDDTEQGAVLGQLHAANTARDALLMTNPNPILSYPINEDGSPSGTLSEVNDAACHLLGYTREKLLKLTPTVLSKTDSWQTAGHDLLHETPAVFEADLICKDGTLLRCKTHA
ncbi:MAG: PAS domain S-box protein, partial [Gammaproteobacteria bacterium]